MSDERYVKITREQRDSDVDWSLGTTPDAICEAFDAAEGQRVETIRWCTTHGERSGRGHNACLDRPDHDEYQPTCEFVEASLILPSEASS